MPPADLPIDRRTAAIVLFVLTLGAVAAFAAFPQADLIVSGWFYWPGEGFRLAGRPWIEAVRNGIWNLSIAVFLLSAAALVLAAAGRPVRGAGARPAGFVFLLYLLGPGLLVNGVLKEHWGRARPVDVVEFGGAAAFTPPWLPADQCASNCSFVSGEGSAAAALAVTFLILAPAARRRLPRAGFALYALAGVLLPLAGLGLRIATGRHFLSDTVFAVLLVLALALGLHALLFRRRTGP